MIWKDMNARSLNEDILLNRNEWGEMDYLYDQPSVIIF